MKSPEFTEEATQAIAGAVRQIASVEPRSWESIAAVACLFASGLLQPPVMTSRFPYLLRQSRAEWMVYLSLLAFSAGLGLSAARNQQRRGRLLGTIVLVVSIVMIGGWICSFAWINELPS